MGLESTRELKINKLIFLDTFDSLLLASYDDLSTEERLTAIIEIMGILDHNTSKGYINDLDLTKYPIISEFLSFFIADESKAEEFIRGNKAMESYKWIYNIIVLNLYLLTIETLHKLDPLAIETELVTDFKTKSLELYGKLDPSIRRHLQKRGISIIQNIYTGFDTEFQTTELGVNKLLSVQLAVTTKTYLKIPRKMNYSVSSLEVDTSQLHPMKKSSLLFNYSKIESTIQRCIDQIRLTKYSKNDVSFLILIECLKQISGLKMNEQDDLIIFSLPRSVIQPFIFIGNSFSFKDMVIESNKIGEPYLEASFSTLMELIKNISSRDLSLENGYDSLLEEIYSLFSEVKILDDLSKDGDTQLPVITKDKPITGELEEYAGMKKLSRQFMSDLLPIGPDNQPLKVSVTKIKNNYFIAHLTQADLSGLTDFENLKDSLNIVNGSFVTLGKPILYAGSNIHLRDTMLLAPAGSRSLASIGKLYGEAFKKVEISTANIESMERFLEDEPDKFKEYAIRDALITLVHASWMEDFNFSLGGVGVPLSLSSIGRKYVKSIWKEEAYSGYQLNPKYLIGDASSTLTPIGLNFIKNVGFVLPYYIANYKGGRNECFMYGIDRDTHWYDYDLTSAYTTVMSSAGHPVYEQCRQIKEYELKKMSKAEILYSYLIIKADFEFKDTVKYPSIPCYIDATSTVYPLKGSCILTGAEYLLAKSQRCKFTIHAIYHIPFSKQVNKNGNEIKPFGEILRLVQEKRREFPKGTISNLMYKEIGNSIYGSVVRGMSNKRKFDIKTGTYIRVEGDELTNPLIAS